MGRTELNARRGFLACMGAVAMTVGLPWKGRAAGGTPQVGPDDWLIGLNGTNRMVFDFPRPGTGAGLRSMSNYIRLFEEAFETPSSDVNAVETFYRGSWRKHVARVHRRDMGEVCPRTAQWPHRPATRSALHAEPVLPAATGRSDRLLGFWHRLAARAWCDVPGLQQLNARHVAPAGQRGFRGARGDRRRPGVEPPAGRDSRARDDHSDLSRTSEPGVQFVEVDTVADLESAINERTAMMFFFALNTDAGQIGLAEFAALGRTHQIPTLIDGSNSVPPLDRLSSSSTQASTSRRSPAERGCEARTAQACCSAAQTSSSPVDSTAHHTPTPSVGA